jgi:flagellar FliL protein
MGFVRVTVELMVNEGNDLLVVEHHAPLLRDAIINVINQQTEDRVNSITGRQEILELCEKKVQELLTQETGKPVVKKLLFTQWLAN